MVLKRETGDLSVSDKNTEGRVITFQYLTSEDFYILGNIVRSLCNSW